MKYYKEIMEFIVSLWNNRYLIVELTKKDLRQRYLGSYLGILWAFIQPTITVLIFWFVFQVGFKSVPVDNFPFVLWLICGMFPWFMFNDSWMGATNSILSNSFLVKKLVFKVELLPVIQIGSALIVNSFFVLLLFFLFACYGFYPCVYNFQILYYMVALIYLVFGLSLITASLVPFMRDVSQLVGMVIQFGFWGTPIFWSINLIPEKFHWILKLNPMYYIIDGYRNSFIYHKWIISQGWMNVSFWIISTIILLVGVFVYKKLRPHFADVL